MQSLRLHRLVPRKVYFSWLPPDVLRLIEPYLSRRDLERLEEAFLCRPDPRPRRMLAVLKAPVVLDRARLLFECRLRGQLAAPPVTLLESLRAARVAQYTTGLGAVIFASYLEWLPVGLLDAYLPYEELVAVERALVPPDDPRDSWDPEGEEAALGAGAPRPPAPAAAASGTPRLSGRQKQQRGHDRRSRRQKGRTQKPWITCG